MIPIRVCLCVPGVARESSCVRGCVGAWVRGCVGTAGEPRGQTHLCVRLHGRKCKDGGRNHCHLNHESAQNGANPPQRRTRDLPLRRRRLQRATGSARVRVCVRAHDIMHACSHHRRRRRGCAAADSGRSRALLARWATSGVCRDHATGRPRGARRAGRGAQRWARQAEHASRARREASRRARPQGQQQGRGTPHCEAPGVHIKQGTVTESET